jgi:hypothetical protein
MEIVFSAAFREGFQWGEDGILQGNPWTGERAQKMFVAGRRLAATFPNWLALKKATILAGDKDNVKGASLDDIAIRHFLPST